MNNNPVLTHQNKKSEEGIVLLNKPLGKTAFHLVSMLRKATKIRTIGHAGTLDPFATGVMVMLVGKPFTKLSSRFLEQDKEYEATLLLGISTDSYDRDGQITSQSDHIPTLEEVQTALLNFQGTVLQTPPMFSAKKIDGKRLYELARKGIEVERKAVPVTIRTQLLSYTYPEIKLHVHCSKGTYIRSIAHDLGNQLGCGAHLTTLVRTRSGSFHLKDCIDPESIFEPGFNIPFIKAL